MTAKTIVNVLLRVWGALWAIGAIIGIPSVLIYAAQAADSQSRHIMLSNGIVELVWLVLGCLLFFKSEQVADAMFPNAEGSLSIAATSRELQEVGFSLLAIYFGLGAVSHLAGIIYQFARMPPTDDQSRFTELAQRNPENLVSTAVQLLACILLFFGTRGLASFWRRIRGRQIEQSNGSSEGGGV